MSQDKMSQKHFGCDETGVTTHPHIKNEVSSDERWQASNLPPREQPSVLLQFLYYKHVLGRIHQYHFDSVMP